MSRFARSKNLCLPSALPLRQPSLFRHFLLVGCLLPLGLDVRKFGDNNGSSLQLLLVTLTLLFGATYCVAEWLSRDLRLSSSKLRGTAILWWIYIGISPFPALLWGIDIEHYLKVLLPFTLFGMGLTLMMAVERRSVDPAILVDIMLWSCLLSTVWRAVYAVLISGLSIEAIRWQILGPGVPFLLGYGVAGTYTGRRRTLSAAALTVGVIAILLSITRSYIFSVALIFAGIFLVDVRRRSLVRAAKTSAKRLAFFGIVVPVAVMLTIAIRPDFFEIWLSRLFQHKTEAGLDITLITRLAEYRGQLDALTQSWWSLIIGNGIGASYVWDADFLAALPFDVDHTSFWFAGHSTWVYPFFASGIIFGAIIPFVFLRSLVWSFKSTSTSVVRRDIRDAITVFAVALAYLGQTFTGNVFGERHTGLILGVVVGSAAIYFGRVSAARRGDRWSQTSIDQGVSRASAM